MACPAQPGAVCGGRGQARSANPPLFSRLGASERVIAGPVSAFALGLYLLGLAWLWPHPDVRASAAGLIGGSCVLIAAATMFVLFRSRSGHVLAALLTAVMAGLGFSLVAFSSISANQQEACGPVLEACDSLLPGL